MKMQIASLLEDYKQEIGKRRQLQLNKILSKNEKSIDKLVKVS